MLAKNIINVILWCIFLLTVQALAEIISDPVTTAEPIPTTILLQETPEATTKLLLQEEEEENYNFSDYKQLSPATEFISNELTSSEYGDDLDGLNADDSDNNDDDDELNDQQNHEWDILIFTQQWPVTTCYHWREEDKTHPCALPNRKEFWTIHGIWPTKLGHIGPNFCNKSSKFNVDQLAQIKENLELYWPDIDGDSSYDWLWKHEWIKHGTCAAVLENLNNELKYFSQGLAWRSRYLISNMLGASGIHPDSNNTVIAIQTALLNELGKNPSIYCLYDNEKDVSYLSEIRICFNKTLQLTDCDGVKRGDAVSIDYPGGNVNTNCHISKPVHYPSLVPPVLGKQREREWKFPVVNLYKLLQLIMWFTL